MSDPKNEQPDELAGTEQPFVQHLMELRDRLIKAVLAIGVVAIVLGLYPGPSALYDLLAAPLVATLPEGATLIATNVVSSIDCSETVPSTMMPALANISMMRARCFTVFFA